jgi:hypothetical protein
MFIAALFTVTKTWHQLRCYQRLKKRKLRYVREYFSFIKKNEVLSFAATWVELEVITFSEIKQKHKYRMFSLICED